MFPDLPAWSPRRAVDADHDRPITDLEADQILKELADTMVERPGLTSEQVVAQGPQADRDSVIPAGYTYFGQFIDHDITFDTASSLQRASDPNGLRNFRTPRLDLDNLYGRGPEDQPYLYDQDHHGTFLLDDLEVAGHPLCVLVAGEEYLFKDLPRNSRGRALIGDMRNDENAMVSQLQLAFLMAHNTLVDLAREAIVEGRADGFGPPGDLDDQAFALARRTLRWLYQYIVWHDFLGRICEEDVLKTALYDPSGDDAVGDRATWELGFKDVYSWKEQPYMPIEFSVAAYRFGHSLVRNSYRPNAWRGDTEVPIFAATRDEPDDLRGFRAMRPGNVIQWDRYLQMTSSTGDFPQKAHLLDPRLSNSLISLHESPELASLLNQLAFRNLKRGWRFGLPSGTAVAHALGVEPIPIAPERDSLWLYILTEAEHEHGGQRLGPVGSILVAATFAGLLKGDHTSWVNQHPRWTPWADPLLADHGFNVDGQPTGPGGEREWTLASIIRIAGAPVDDAFFPEPGPVPLL